MDIMRNCFTIGLAGLIIEIDTISPRTCIYCMNYLKDGMPDLKIQIREDDIKQEAIECGEIKRNAISLETLAAYRKIAINLLDYGIVLMHGAVVAVDNYAYMFSAPSETGKTTHIKKWLRNINGAFVVNGDKPLIKVTTDKLIACGTPWSGNERLNTNTMVALKSIVFMERSETNHIEEASFAQAYPYLLQQTFRPRDAESAKKTLEILSQMYGKSTFWKFYCNNFADDCFNTAYNALVRKA